MKKIDLTIIRITKNPKVANHNVDSDMPKYDYMWWRPVWKWIILFERCWNIFANFTRFSMAVKLSINLNKRPWKTGSKHIVTIRNSSFKIIKFICIGIMSILIILDRYNNLNTYSWNLYKWLNEYKKKTS